MRELDVVQHQQIDGLRIYINTIDYRTPHFHTDIEIIWALEGSLEVQSEDFHHVVNEGEIILFNSKQTHELRKVDKSCTLLGIQFSPGIISKEVPMIEYIHFDRYCLLDILPRGIYKKIQLSWLEMAYKYFEKSQYYELFCISHIQEFVYLLLINVSHHILTTEKISEQKRQNARLRRLIQFVDQNYMNKIRLTDFAEKEGYSMSCISHFMKAATNHSFQEYVNIVRFNAACELIAEGKMKMLDVCVASGFSDYRYFSNIFVKRTGMTPDVYSRQVQNSIPSETKVHHSIHSLERFYSPEQSLRLLKSFQITD